MNGMLPQTRLWSEERCAGLSAAGKKLTRLSSQPTPTSFRARVTAGHTSRRYFSADMGGGGLQHQREAASAQPLLCIGLNKNVQVPSAQHQGPRIGLLCGAPCA